MKAIFKTITKKEYKTKKGNKFTKIEFTCDVKMNKEGDIKTLRGSYNEDFARKYLSFCGITTKDLIGTEVEVVVAKKSYESEGKMVTYNYIKYFNVLDVEGKPIYLPKEEKETDIDF